MQRINVSRTGLHVNYNLKRSCDSNTIKHENIIYIRVCMCVYPTNIHTHTHLYIFIYMLYIFFFSQFAYKLNRSIEDAILTLIHNTFLHTNNPKSYVRIPFADFSYTLNTIKPYCFAKKLIWLNISPKLVIWIITFLCHEKHFVRFKGVLSGERSISTGVQQGCVLSPVLV